MRKLLMLFILPLLMAPSGCRCVRDTPREDVAALNVEAAQPAVRLGKPMVVSYIGKGGCIVTVEPEIWGRVTGSLRRGVRVTMLDSRGNFALIEYSRDGQTHTGWVLAESLAEKLTPIKRTADPYREERVWAGSLREPIEVDVKSRHGDRFEYAMRIVDRLEATRNEHLGGDATDPDPIEYKRNIREFGESGGLTPGR